MTPKQTDNYLQLFNSSLANILNDKHPLYKLANAIDWQQIEKELAECYSPDMGRPGNTTRLMVGLHYLKSLRTSCASPEGLALSNETFNDGNISAATNICSTSFRYIRRV